MSHAMSQAHLDGRSYTSDLACCSGSALSSSESPAQDPRKMSSAPTAHMHEGGAAALTFETCSAMPLITSWLHDGPMWIRPAPMK